MNVSFLEGWSDPVATGVDEGQLDRSRGPKQRNERGRQNSGTEDYLTVRCEGRNRVDAISEGKKRKKNRNKKTNEITQSEA